MNNEVNEWLEQLASVKYPRWEELPDLELYMDQVIILLERYLSFLKTSDHDYIVTNTMINNYVKLNLIPKPKKKKYNKQHIAYLVAILSLKQVLSITEIRDGIEYQASFSGTKAAYNYFCDQQELAIRQVIDEIHGNDNSEEINKIENESQIVIKLGTRAFASKIVASYIVSMISRGRVK